MKCSCGGVFEKVEGMEGYFCDTCNCFREDTFDDSVLDVTKMYTEDKLKSIRGVPVNRITIGSESKGRLEISFPIFVSKEEQKALISQQLDLLEFTISEIKNRNIDIIPKR